MCDFSGNRRNFTFFFLLVILSVVRGLSVEKDDLMEASNDTDGKQNLPTSNVQIHYNQTFNNNNNSTDSLSTTINFEIGLGNTTSASAINKPVGDLPYCGCYCGTGSRTHRIVGGNVTKIHEYPWMAAMYRKGSFYCGGTLITRRHVLTAAHCLYGFNPQDLKIVLGEFDRNVDTDGVTVERKIKVAKRHLKFSLLTFNNDIGIVELDKPVTLGDNIKTACLPNDENFNYTGRYGIVAGWGRTGESEPTSGKLRHVTLPILSREECRKTGYAADRITENMICVGYKKGMKDSCQGDSGGPMVIEVKKGQFELAGIVSWGRGCARPNYPGVYTKIVNYKSWIQENVGHECFCQRP